MRSKERLRLNLIMNIFHHRMRNAHAIKGARTAAHLVKDNQAVFRGVFQNLRHLVHLHHEGALACRQIIAGTHARKDFINRTNIRLTRGDKAAHLRHQHQQCHLTHICRLACHIRAGNYHHALICIIKVRIIRHEDFLLQQAFHHRMAAIGNLYLAPVVQLRTDIIIFISCQRQRIEHINAGNRARCLLNLDNLAANQAAQLVKQIIFQLLDFFLRTKNFILKRLQLRHNVTLCVHQRLLAHEIIGHAARLSLADLDIVAKNLIIANLERLDAGFILHLLLKVLHPRLVIRSNLVQLVQLTVIAGANHAALAHGKRRLIHNRALQNLGQLLMQMQLAAQLTQQAAPAAGQNILQSRQHHQRITQGHKVTCIRTAHLDAAHDTLQIGHGLQLLGYRLAQAAVCQKLGHGLLTLGNTAKVEQRTFNPAAQTARTHRGFRKVQHVQQRTALRAVRHAAYQLQIAYRRDIKIHKAVALDTRQTVDVAQIRHNRAMQIAQQALHSLVYLRRYLGAGKVLRKISRLRRFAVIATHSAIRQPCCQPLTQPVNRLLIAKTDHHFRRLHSVNLLRDIQKRFLAVVKEPFAFACRNISRSKAQLMSCKLLQKDKITVMLVL